MSSTTGQPRNRRYIRVSQQRKTMLRWPENSIEHQNVHRRRSRSSSASIYIRVYTSEADSTNPRSMEEECEYGLPSGTCFTARSLEVVAVAGLLWTYFVVFFLVSGGISFFFRFLYFDRTRPIASTRQPCLMYLSTSNEARPRERSDRCRFLPIGQKASSYRGAYRVPLFERSEFLIDTSPKKIRPCVCSTNLGFSVGYATNLGFSVGYVICSIYVCTWYQPAEITSCEKHSMVVYIH